jgi:hypothetical protein
VREEALEAQFTELLGRLRIDAEVLEWVREALHASTPASGASTRKHPAPSGRIQAAR